MNELFQFTVFSIGDTGITTGNIAGVVIIVALSFVLFYILNKILNYQVARKAMKRELKRKLRRLFILAIILLDAVLVLRVIGLNVRSLMTYELIDIAPLYITPFHLFIFVFALILIQLIIIVVRKVFDRMIEHDAMEIGLGMATYQIIKYTIWFIAIILLLDVVGVKITILLAGAGALLIGIGFGIQQIFSDIISGFIILFERNLKVHDVVELDEVVGRVQSIGLRTSRIVTRDNIEILVPNTRFIADNVVNWSHMEKATRFHVKVGVAYGSDVRKVEQVLLDCTNRHPDVLEDPAPFVFFKDFGNSSLDFELYFWTYHAFRFEKIRSDLRFDIDANFRKNAIQIPFPQRDIHIRTK